MVIDKIAEVAAVHSGFGMKCAMHVRNMVDIMHGAWNTPCFQSPGRPRGTPLLRRSSLRRLARLSSVLCGVLMCAVC